MIGDGELWESCKQLAENLEISRVVEFLGPRSQVEVAAELRQVRAFVQHSIRASRRRLRGHAGCCVGSWRGWPSCGGDPAHRHSDVVIEEETGLLVDERDVEGMATHMMQLAQDPGLAGRMGNAARKRVAMEFSMETSIERLWRIITNCAGLSGNGHERTHG